MAKLQEMINVMKEHDLTASSEKIATHAAALAVVKAGTTKPTPGLHPSELTLIDEDEDPFNGNANNRRVAERIAAQGNRVYANNSRPIHTGDPAKARADIAKSKRLNPDVVPDADFEESVPARKPTPGSPAALKAENGAATAAPPVWKP